MIDRHKVETLLRRRFPNAPWDQIATATNAIVGLDDEWSEVVAPDFGHVDQEMKDGVEYRVFRRRADGRLGPSGEERLGLARP